MGEVVVMVIVMLELQGVVMVTGKVEAGEVLVVVCACSSDSLVLVMVVVVVVLISTYILAFVRW